MVMIFAQISYCRSPQIITQTLRDTNFAKKSRKNEPGKRINLIGY